MIICSIYIASSEWRSSIDTQNAEIRYKINYSHNNKPSVMSTL